MVHIMKQGNSITRSGPWWINHVVSAYNVSVDGFKRRRDFVMTRGENCSKEYCRIDLRAGALLGLVAARGISLCWRTKKSLCGCSLSRSVSIDLEIFVNAFLGFMS